MSKGYPSKSRARRAFERGVECGFRRRAGRCPYPNPRLAALWERGRQMGLQGRAPKPRKLPPRRPAAPPVRRPAKTWQGWNGGGR